MLHWPCRAPLVPVLTEAEGLAGAPEGAGGVAADEPVGTLQLVAGSTAEAGIPAGVQAADRDLPESRPRREGAAQQVGWGQAAVSRGPPAHTTPSTHLPSPPGSTWVTWCLAVTVGNDAK